MDIIGFDEQIGATFAKGMKNMVKKTASKITPKVVVKKPSAPLKKMVMVKPSALIPKAKAVVVKPAPMAKKIVAVKPSALMPRAQQVPISFPKKKILVKPTPIFSTDKKKVMFQKNIVTTQKVLPNIQKLSPQNQIKVVRSEPVTPQTMAVLNPVQRSFTKADLPYRPVVKSNPIVRIKNTPISYSTSIDMIEPPVDAGTTNYYGK
jgi:hypothetical protein